MDATSVHGNADVQYFVQFFGHDGSRSKIESYVDMEEISNKGWPRISAPDVPDLPD